MSDVALTETQAAVYELIKNPIAYDRDDLRELSGYKKNFVEQAVQELLDMKLVFQYQSSVTGKTVLAQCVDITGERYVDFYRPAAVERKVEVKAVVVVKSNSHEKRHRSIMTQDLEDAIHKVLMEGELTQPEMATKLGVSIQTIRRRKLYYGL
jgi:hypothetical protein